MRNCSRARRAMIQYEDVHQRIAVFLPSLLVCFFSNQPLLRWVTFGPVVRAAATAHPQIPARIASIGIEMAEAAVNFVPSRDGTISRTIGCNQQQGVLVLSAAFRLVAQADVGSQETRKRTGGGGLYSQWFTNCFGPKGEGGASRGVEQAEIRPASPGFDQDKQAPEPHGAGPQLSRSEVCKNPWLRGCKKTPATRFWVSLFSPCSCSSVVFC